jgi:hypothetical protein
MIRTFRFAAPVVALAAAACAGNLLPPDDPPCASPAPLQGAPDPRAPGFIVVFRDGTDVDATVGRLTARYAFQTKHVYRSALLGFAADLTPVQLAGVRCEAEVKYVEHDGAMRLGAH